MSTLAVVEQILRETKIPMSVRQIVEHARGRLPTKSKTPDTVVARDLSMDIKRKGEASIFIRTAPGRYTIREIHLQNLAEQQAAQADAAAQIPASSAQRQDQPTAAQPASSPPAPQPQSTSIISSALRENRAGPLPARSASSSADEQRTDAR